MKQQMMIRFFVIIGLKAKDIYAELESVYYLEGLAPPTVKKSWIRFQQGRMDLVDDPMSGRPLTNDFGEAIGSMPAEKPFSSCKMLSCRFQIRKTMGFQILDDKKFRFCWVRHAQPANQKSE
jgi:hypothetical protein